MRVRITHGFSIAVVSCDKDNSTFGSEFFNYFPQACIYGFTCLDRSLHYAAVPNHITVGKIEDDECIMLAIQAF